MISNQRCITYYIKCVLNTWDRVNNFKGNFVCCKLIEKWDMWQKNKKKYTLKILPIMHKDVKIVFEVYNILSCHYGFDISHLIK